ncbi:MAG: iron ABC transporter permease [Clostridia bacterium]|nr:iron ABC transporter permease [Clostridia bacterium]
MMFAQNGGRAACVVVLALLGVLSILICVGIGTVPVTPAEVIRALFVDDGSTARLLVWELRLPRVLCCALVGICLSLSGCILQGVMRNHMASPSTIGVTGGASLVGYLTLVVCPQYAALLPLGAILGAFAATMLIYALAYRRGASPVKMILSGMAVSALCGACNDMIKLLFAGSLGNASGFLVGGFNGCVWPSVGLIAPYALVGGVICIFLPTGLNLLMLGDEPARALGLRSEAFRFLLIAVASILAGASIAVAGLISFVGLIVPHIARLLVGSDYRWLMPASACLGCALVTVCDTVGRVILPPGEIPAGVILSLLGAPFFLWLLRNRETGGEG